MFKILHFAQVVKEFDDSPSSMSLYLFLLLLRWHCCRDKLTAHCRGNVCLPSVGVCTPSVQFPDELLQ